MDQPYSNRELDSKFNEMKNIVNDNHTETLIVLGRVETQTIKTNGRVSKNEEEIASLNSWKFGLIMAGSVITAVVIPLVLYIFYTQTTEINNQLKELKTEINK